MTSSPNFATGPGSGSVNNNTHTRTHEHTHASPAILCVTLGSTILARLEWRGYYDVIHSFLTGIKKRPQLDKLLIKLVVECLDNFHFDIGVAPNAALQTQAEKELADRELAQQRELDRKLNQEKKGMLALAGPEAPEEEGTGVAQKGKAKRGVTNKWGVNVEGMTQDEEDANHEEDQGGQVGVTGDLEEEDLPPVDYTEWLVVDLRTELKRRGADAKGLKADLATRLKTLDEAAGKDEEEEEEESVLPEVAEEEEPSEEAKGLALSHKIQSVLVDRILPALQAYMKGGTDAESHKVASRVHVAIAAVRVLKLLPDTVCNATLPRMLIPLVNVLKNREQNIRDVARTTLVRCMGVLGVEYLGYVIGQLRHALSKGFERHVLGYTVHSIVVELESQSQVGDFDYCIDLLTEVNLSSFFSCFSFERERASSGIRILRWHQSEWD